MTHGKLATRLVTGLLLPIAMAAAWSWGAHAAAQVHAPASPKDATPPTKAIHGAVLTQLPFSSQQDFDDAQRGFVATLSPMTIRAADPSVPPVWDLTRYAFLKQEHAPPTVNPSLWRIARLNMNHGLYQVTEGVYQIRGFDISNMTIVEGKSGVIVIDPLVTVETARAGLELYYRHRPRRPVRAVIHTHSHVDHYGGVKGVVREQDVKTRKVSILAPAGFLEEAVRENVYAGNAMSRRALYQYGIVLPAGERGQVDAGLGKSTSLGGTITLIAPTDTIETTGTKRTVDGVQMEFLMAPHTEAPAEMLIYFPQHKLLCATEDATHTLHNLYTLRGAQVRDASAWWKALHQAIQMFGDRTEVVLAQHHWPKWGRVSVVAYLEKQRDVYKYIHDQTLRLMNHGYTPNEIAEVLSLPPSLEQEWHVRGYYGSVSHNAKAVYQRYLGWYDSNPANLNPLPPEQAGKKYVEFMGGAPAVLEKAQRAFGRGEYRWVAEVLKHVVFADPQNQAARALQADAMEQLGYQNENPTWRNEYLMGAFELRNGVPNLGVATASVDSLRAMTNEMLLDYMGMRLNGPKAAGKAQSYNFVFEGGDKLTVQLANGVLVYTIGKQLPVVDATVTWPRESLISVLFGASSLDAELAAGRVRIEGDRAKLEELLGLLDRFAPMFNIVTP